MIPVRFPEVQFRLKTENGERYIFDPLRKAWIILTEEEWVRQHFIRYLLDEMQYPASLMAVEKAIDLNGLRKRFDILVYNGDHQPWMMIECKAPEIALSEAVLQQVLRYNMSVPVTFIVITNGHATLGWKKEGNGLVAITALPAVVKGRS